MSAEQASGCIVIIQQITGLAGITGQRSSLRGPEDRWQAGDLLSDIWGVTRTLKP